MPYQVTKEKSATETPTKTRMQLAKDLKGMPQGKTVVGYIGEEPQVDEPEPKEELTGDEINERTAIQELIKKYIQAPALGSKFTARQCEMRFVKKVNSIPLSTLRKLRDKPVPGDREISSDEQVELQRMWEDISP